MSNHNQPLEIHIHGDVPLKYAVTQADIEATIAPLLLYNQSHYQNQGKASLYEEEPGIQFTASDSTLRLCWSIAGNQDFRETLDEFVMGLNDISREGAALEVSFYDLEAEDDDEWNHNKNENDIATDEENTSRDDFFMVFVGPTPAAIMQVQHDLLLRDVTTLVGRHFEDEEMEPIIAALNQMWEKRLTTLISSLKFPPHNNHSNNFSGTNTHNGINGRKSRHSH